MIIDAVTAGWLRARSRMARGELTAPLGQDFRARILDVTVEEYLADPCVTPSLSAGIAHVLVSESPLRGYTAHPRLGGGSNGAATKAMNDGTLIHKLLLGKGKELELIDAPDFRTNAAREVRDAAFAAGKVPVLQHHYAEKLAASERLRERCAQLGYVFDGESEVAVEWCDDSTGEPVLCRSMFDHVFVKGGRIFDVKKAASVNPKDIARSFCDFGYDVQYAAYTRALGKLRPEFAGRVDLVFLFVELEPPYEVVPVEPSGEFKEIGARRWESAVRLWRECMDSGEWPGYCVNGRVRLEAPRWLVAQELSGETL